MKAPTSNSLAAVLALCVGTAFVGAPSSARGVQDPSFAASVQLAGAPLDKVGSGIYRFAKLVKVCAAALYLPPGTKAEQALADVPKQLEIFYYREVTAEQFVSMGDEALRENVSNQEWARIQPHLRLFNGFYRNVQAGDRYTLSYHPGQGIELALNGQPLGVIEDPEFASVYYRIWLGSKSVSNRFRDQILGLR